nr:brain Na++/Ca++ exchanger-associated protein [Rattus norvegicus]
MRGYAEKLIDYGKLGDTNERAMRIADFWLTEKDLIPKLFKVLAPRFPKGQNCNYTRMLQIPNRKEQDRAKMAVIEYKGNCLPPLPLPHRDSNLTLLNQLLLGLQQDLHHNQKASLHSSHTVKHQRLNWSWRVHRCGTCVGGSWSSCSVCDLEVALWSPLIMRPRPPCCLELILFAQSIKSLICIYDTDFLFLPSDFWNIRNMQMLSLLRQ